MTEDRQNKRRPPMTPERLQQAGLNYLARFAATAAQLRRVLARRVALSVLQHESDPAPLMAAIDALIARWRAAGLLNDGEYAAAKAVSLHRRGLPKSRIAGKLREKGVESDLIDQILQESEEIGSDLAAAVAYARRRRLGPFRSTDLRAGFYQKDLGSLARAGFDRRTAQAILDAEDVELLVLD